MKPRPAKAKLKPRDAATQASLAALTLRVDQLASDVAVQFTRIAQLQAEMDVMKAEWARVQTQK